MRAVHYQKVSGKFDKHGKGIHNITLLSAEPLFILESTLYRAYWDKSNVMKLALRQFGFLNNIAIDNGIKTLMDSGIL